MPYIIETKQPGPVKRDGTPLLVASGRPVAVAALDKARETVAIDLVEHIGNNSRIQRMVDTLDNSGGTVGPLPDGTVIEVRQVDWATVWAGADLPNCASDYRDDQLLAAFNAA